MGKWSIKSQWHYWVSYIKIVLGLCKVCALLYCIGQVVMLMWVGVCYERPMVVTDHHHVNFYCILWELLLFIMPGVIRLRERIALANTTRKKAVKHLPGKFRQFRFIG